MRAISARATSCCLCFTSNTLHLAHGFPKHTLLLDKTLYRCDTSLALSVVQVLKCAFFVGPFSACRRLGRRHARPEIRSYAP